jgi:hypothetical protein
MKADQTLLDLNSDEPIVCRSVWISDIHLGTKHARVTELLDFLRVVDCKYLYLVGDFIDGWELKFRWYWRDDYNVLIQKLLRKSRRQTKVIYISGNHDEFIEQFMGMKFGNVTIARQVIGSSANSAKSLPTWPALMLRRVASSGRRAVPDANRKWASQRIGLFFTLTKDFRRGIA